MFDDLFGEFMGGAAGAGPHSRGADLRYNLEITLEEAFTGKQAQIRVPTTVRCEVCNATGVEQGRTGRVARAAGGPAACAPSRASSRSSAPARPAPGTGRVITDPCEACGGSGRVHREKTLSVTIPQGVEDGTRIRLTGEGEAGTRGGAPGDLYIFVSVAPHRMFKRDGSNLYCRVPIPVTTAALGGQLEVPTIDGRKARLQVPAGTQTGHRFRLRSKGMTELHGHTRADMFCEIVVETPVNLTRRQQELLREFEQAGNGATNPESEGFFAKVKELWDELRD